MRFFTKRGLLTTSAVILGLLCIGAQAAPATAPVQEANGDYAWATGVQYTKGQVVDFQGGRFQVVTSHISQSDWFPGCCAPLWKSVGASDPTAAAVGGAAVSGGTVGAAILERATVATGWGTRTFAPYLDVMLWPTLDASTIMSTYGVKHFTLAFIFAGGDGSPTWGGVTALSSNFYGDIITKLRSLGGDVIVSFGGAIGSELAQVTTSATTLQSRYQSVINMYQLTWIDFDIEGAALVDTAANDLRNKVLVLLKKANPKLRISYTLPALPTGLTADGIALLKSAVKAGFTPDVINIMAMDYGSGVAPNGATGMGGYAISAAKATYLQAQAAGLKTTQIGVTPMIGVNDVAGETFRLADATQLAAWAVSVNYVATLGFWSINRDTSKTGALYASSQVTQTDYAFAKIFLPFESGTAAASTASTGTTTTGTTSSGTTSSGTTTSGTTSTSGTSTTALTGGTWGTKVFAPYVDVLDWPTLDASAVAKATGSKYFTLAFVVADATNAPSWGGVTAVSTGFYLDILTKLRAQGGDAIISFGGASGTELAIAITSVTKLTAAYQAVINTYGATWLDFDVEGAAVTNTAANIRRNQALTAIQKANPKVRISYTLPVMPTGLDSSALAIFTSALQYKTRIDVVNIMAMDYGSGAAPNGATGMATYAIAAAKATYAQLQTAGFTTTKVGVTPMIGVNDVAGEVFRVADATTLVKWAASTSWVGELAFWSVNRDTSVQGALYISSQITQKTYDFANAFKAFNVAATVSTRDDEAADAATTDDSTSTDDSDASADVATVADLPPWTYHNMPVPPARGSVKEVTPDPSLILTEVTKRSASDYLGSSTTWTTKTFAPYIDVTAWPTFDFVGAAKTTGLRHFSLGFIVTDKDGDPSWGGYYKVTSDFLVADIKTLRSTYHGDVIVSFGGAAGKELATKAKTVAALVTQYQLVIDTHKVTWADFDIEGATLTNKKAVDRRNQALATIQKNNPGLVISYTLPTETTGIGSAGEYLLNSAVKAGLTVDLVNVMAMDYDPSSTSGKTMGQNAVAAATACEATLKSLSLTSTKVGVTPMIGVNDVSGETFTLNNAQEVVNFALKTDWLGFIGFWSINRDNSVKAEDLDVSSGITQGDWGFSLLFAVFSSA
ncbi:hypothetical protein HKX48_000272 [Thoreauomyces humboldtii]|nr:hypothetical protein HKX48_000272 [Thoreauomyces humboldtii]